MLLYLILSECHLLHDFRLPKFKFFLFLLPILSEHRLSVHSLLHLFTYLFSKILLSSSLLALSLLKVLHVLVLFTLVVLSNDFFVLQDPLLQGLYPLLNLSLLFLNFLTLSFIS
jgi:hypothetical protein